MAEHFDPEDSRQYRSNHSGNDDISLIDLAVAIARHKKLILFAPLITALIAGLVTLFIPNTYTATIKLQAAGGKVSDKTLLSLLNSADMSDSLVRRCMLKDVASKSSVKQLRKKLLNSVKVGIGNEGLINVSVNDSNLARAVRISTAIPSVLNALLSNYALTEEAQRRELLQRQLPDIRKELLDAKNRMAQERGSEGFMEPQSRVLELVRKSSELKARIAMKEHELLSMDVFDPAKNQNNIKVQQELNSLWFSLGKLDADPAISAGVSGKQRDYLACVREVVYNDTRYDQLLKQIEIARLEESKSAQMVQMIGHVEVPEEPSEPRREVIIIVSAAVAGFFAVLWSLFSEAVSWAGKDSRNAESIQEFRDALKW